MRNCVGSFPSHFYVMKSIIIALKVSLFYSPMIFPFSSMTTLITLFDLIQVVNFIYNSGSQHGVHGPPKGFLWEHRKANGLTKKKI